MFNLDAAKNFDKGMSDLSASIEWLMNAQVHVYSALREGQEPEQEAINEKLKAIQNEIRDVRKQFAEVYCEIEGR